MTVPTVPISGKAFRIAPAQHGQPVASFWKFWIEGNELYAMNRDARSMKVSVHATGQTHMRMEGRDLQLLFPPLPLAEAGWQHALEVRYLVAPDRFRPTPKKLKKKDTAFLIDVADGQALVLNLLLSSPDSVSTIPTQFSGAQVLWVATLADGRQASLIGRVLPLDNENQEHLSRLRGYNGPKATFESQPTQPHLELSQVFWGTGGNVILIVPAGAEIIRSLGQPASLEPEAAKRRQPEVEYASPDGSLILHAPNGMAVAELRLTGEKGFVKLSKNEHVDAQLGQFSLSLVEGSLLVGERFELRPIALPAIPSIGGYSPREWNYPVRCSYNGSDLTVRLLPMSTTLAIQSSSSDSLLQTGEELVLTAPSSDLTLNASPSVPCVSVKLSVKLLLCDVVKP